MVATVDTYMYVNGSSAAYSNFTDYQKGIKHQDRDNCVDDCHAEEKPNVFGG